MAIQKMTSETLKKILLKTANALPNKPSERGITAEQLKKYFFEFVTSENDSIRSELDRIVDEVNQELESGKIYTEDAIVQRVLSYNPVIEILENLDDESIECKHISGKTHKIKVGKPLEPNNITSEDGNLDSTYISRVAKDQLGNLISFITATETIITSSEFNGKTLKYVLLELKNQLSEINATFSLDISSINSRIESIVGGAPELLDTLDELSQALNDNPNAINEILNVIAEIKASLQNKVEKIDGKQLSTNDYTDEDLSFISRLKLMDLAVKGDIPDVINELDKSSNNPISSKAVAEALAQVQNSLTFDSTPTQNSSNLVTSGSIYTALLSKTNDADLSSVAKSGKFSDLLETPDLATKQFVKDAIAELVGTAGETMDTLGEIQKAIEEHEDVTDAINSAIALKANKTDLDTTNTKVSTLEANLGTKANQTDLDSTNAKIEELEQELDAIPEGVKVNDTLTSTSTIEALSANQGRLLNNIKLNAQQGTTYAGMFMKVGEDGLLNPSSIDYSDIQNRITKLLDLSDDSTHRLVTDSEKSKWNAKLDSSSISAWAKASTKPTYSYSEITDTPDLGNFIDKDVNNLTNYSLTTDVGNKISLNIDKDSYVMTLNLLNSNDEVLSSGTIDLPLETMVVDASYNNEERNITLTLKNGTTTSFSVADLVKGLVSDSRTINGKALSSNITLSALDVGALPNTTVIPTVNDGILTIQKNGTTVKTFTANSSSNVTANIEVPTKTSELTNDSKFIDTDDFDDALNIRTQYIFDSIADAYPKKTELPNPYINGTTERLNSGHIIYVPTSAGSSGQILTSSGGGEPTWENAPEGIIVINNLTSTSTTSALSAYQGKVLKDGLDTKATIDDYRILQHKSNYNALTWVPILDTSSSESLEVVSNEWMRSENLNPIDQYNGYEQYKLKLHKVSRTGKASDLVDYADLAKVTYVNTAIANLVNSAPTTLDTLGELATAIQENEDLITTLNSAIGNKANKATTLSGYGITDAKISNGTITLGSTSIKPLTSFTETDPTVPSWAKQSSKPTYTWTEITNKPTLFSGSYNDLSDKPTIPTKTTVTTGSANGTISVDGSDVAVKGLGSLAYSSTTYAGGTAVTLNGTSKSGSTVSFYAPTSYGTSGAVLVANGSGSAPTWSTTFNAYSATYAISASGYTTPISINNFTTATNQVVTTTSSGVTTIDITGSSSEANFYHRVYFMLAVYDTDTNYAWLYSDLCDSSGTYATTTYRGMGTSTNARTNSCYGCIVAKRYIYLKKNAAFDSCNFVILGTEQF